MSTATLTPYSDATTAEPSFPTTTVRAVDSVLRWDVWDGAPSKKI